MMSARPGRICFLGCAAGATERLGLDITEPRLLAAAIGMRFRFGTVRASRSATQPVAATIEINSCDMHLDSARLASFYRGYGVHMTAWVREDASRLMSELGEISVDRPILLMVNSAQLPHWPAAARATAGHYLVCDGWNASENRASIVDAFVPAAQQPFFQGDVPLDELLRAVDCAGFMGRSYCAAWTFATAEDDERVAPVLPAETLRRSARNMIDAVDEHFEYGGLEVTVVNGLRGIDRLAAEVDRVAAGGDSGLGAMREIFPLVASFGGPVSARAVLADFLESATDVGRDAAQLASASRALSSGWKTFAHLVLKGVSGAGTPALVRAGDYLQRLRRDERTLAEALSSLDVSQG